VYLYEAPWLKKKSAVEKKIKSRLELLTLANRIFSQKSVKARELLSIVVRDKTDIRYKIFRASIAKKKEVEKQKPVVEKIKSKQKGKNELSYEYNNRIAKENGYHACGCYKSIRKR